MNLNEVIEGNYTPVANEEPELTLEQQWAKYDEVLAEYGEKEAENFMPREPRPVHKEPKAKAQSTGTATPAAESKGNPKLTSAIREMEKTKSVEALDEIYIRAEAEFEGAELEALLREYRRIKSGIGNLI
jgi:hypothetical protein